MEKKNIAVLISGGVDSAVVVHRLMEEGHNLNLFYIRIGMDDDEGDWLFFVTVNPDTGETKFARSQKDHDNNVKEFEQWCSENRERC